MLLASLLPRREDSDYARGVEQGRSRGAGSLPASDSARDSLTQQVHGSADCIFGGLSTPTFCLFFLQITSKVLPSRMSGLKEGPSVRHKK